MTTFVALAFCVWFLMVGALLCTRTLQTLLFLCGLAFAFCFGLILGSHAPSVAWVYFNGLGLFAFAAPLTAIWHDWKKMRRRGP